ncbi:uncharacterized protein LOC143209645 [Lasioglossum baleicum]|uniref:uncharacterized protein LOC143209645 n=1 Tax=Lasioglossum baleicum TaxID=434251 RepID=UPI003FCEAC2C
MTGNGSGRRECPEPRFTFVLCAWSNQRKVQHSLVGEAIVVWETRANCEEETSRMLGERSENWLTVSRKKANEKENVRLVCSRCSYHFPWLEDAALKRDAAVDNRENARAVSVLVAVTRLIYEDCVQRLYSPANGNSMKVVRGNRPINLLPSALRRLLKGRRI